MFLAYAYIVFPSSLFLVLRCRILFSFDTDLGKNKVEMNALKHHQLLYVILQVTTEAKYLQLKRSFRH